MSLDITLKSLDETTGNGVEEKRVTICVLTSVEQIKLIGRDVLKKQGHQVPTDFAMYLNAYVHWLEETAEVVSVSHSGFTTREIPEFLFVCKSWPGDKLDE